MIDDMCMTLYNILFLFYILENRISDDIKGYIITITDGLNYFVAIFVISGMWRERIIYKQRNASLIYSKMRIKG